MDLRPSAARWFEIVVPRVDADDALEALARRGGVEFQWAGGPGAGGQIEPLRGRLARYRALAADHSAYWPDPVFAKRCCVLPIEAAASAAIRQLERWRKGADPLLETLDAARREREGVELWRPLLALPQARALDLAALSAAGPALAGFCLVLPAGVEPPGGTPRLELAIPLGERRALIGLAARASASVLCERARALGGTCLPLPDWLSTLAQGRDPALSERRAGLDRRIEQLEAELRALAEQSGVAHARGVLERIDWFCRTAQDIHCDGDYCWITGWTSEGDAATVEGVLGEAGVNAAVAFPDPPVDVPAPSVSRNPAWLRPFEVFTQAVGVPGVREADPTTWVALLVPLMFGYMCGDVGHGAVIAAAGLMLRRRTPLWPLLVVCGLAAIGFGFVYGDVFGYEHLIPALWVRPLEEPFLVLAVPVAAGALILTLGVLLHLVQTCWQGDAGSRGVADVAQLLVYWGILLAFADLRLGWFALAGLALCLGNRLWTERRLLALVAGLGHLVQGTFELLLNTLSFARLGAFALAHAALESAVVGIAGGVETLAAAVAIAVAGNLLVILLEGLVVSIQTTRLVLFEFFARFFEGQGRRFQPAGLPPAAGDLRDRR
jgi:V/A-type H+-transporting ATPase subunit I